MTWTRRRRAPRDSRRRGAKYKGKADAEATILKKINDPKGDHPEMKAKPDDVKAVVKWMLSL